MSDALEQLADEAGVVRSYYDQMGGVRTASPETLRAILAELDLPAASDAEAQATVDMLRARRDGRSLPEWRVVDAGAFRPGADVWTMRLESGETAQGGPGDSVDLPPGYHHLHVGEDRALILAVPPRPPLPDKAWGATLPLYGLRTEAQGGFGDYADLACAVQALGGLGASFVGINPIHAGFPRDPNNVSPYSPSHRRRLNVLHIAAEGATSPDGTLIDYHTAAPARMDALQAAFDAFEAAGGEDAFDQWRASQGEGLEKFAIHQALSDSFGSYWTVWPEPYQNHDAPEVRAFAAENARAVTFHAWLQWEATRQLEEVGRVADEAGMAHGLYLDLAVGTNHAGAETWADPTVFAHGVSLGAPPDAFSAEGQNWGLAPLSPRGLVAQDFRPLIETLRTQLRFARLLRIDHILGFDRAFWVPQGAPGTYVQMPKAAMLAVARIEADRAGATVVGEDLGNIPEGLQGDLAGAGLLGCRVAMFERTNDRFSPPEQWEPLALASFGTHDLPTYAGWRAGRDIDWRHQLGHIDDDTAASARDERSRDVTAFDALVGGGDVDTMHAHLGRTASALVALQVEDMLELVEQPNLPGTTDEHPNWRRRLPVGAEGLAEDPAVARAAGLMSRAGR